MAVTDLPDSEHSYDNDDRIRTLHGPGTESEIIDLDTLTDGDDGTVTTLFFEAGFQTSFSKLLNAVPMGATLIDRSHTIVRANDWWQTVTPHYLQIIGAHFESFFPKPEHARKAWNLLEKAFTQRRPVVLETGLRVQDTRLWGRLFLRSMRMGGQRFVLLLLQDLTREKKQGLTNRKHEQELIEAREELERRIEARAAELSRANEQLLQESEQRREMDYNLAKSKETIEVLLNASTDIAFLVDTEGTLLAMNRHFSDRIAGRDSGLLGQPVYGLFPRLAVKRLRDGVANVVGTGKGVRYEERLNRRFFASSLYPVVGTGASVEGVAVFLRDKTESKRARQKLNLAAKIIESSREGIVVTDTAGIIVDVNEAFGSLTGYSRDDVLGRNPSMMKSGRHDAEFYRNMWTMLIETGHWSGEVWDRRKNGELFAKLLSISAVRNDLGEVTHYVGIFSDITKIKQTEERLQHMAHFDPLTRLPNRLLFRDRLHHALVETGRHKQMVALMLLDLDRFKDINDTLGHKAGDDLLVTVAERLVGCVRKSDTVARLGGDEFTVVLSEIAGPSAVASVARKILQVLAEPFDLAGRSVFVTASVGITLYPSDGAKVDRLLQNADMALYRAKELGKNTFQFFSPEMNLEVKRRIELEQDLRGALDRNEFVVYYQPRLDTETGHITGGEALLRWNHPKRGLVSPDEFISVAEETGLIVPIGEWVLRTACTQTRTWQQLGLPPVTIAVNVAARQLSYADLADTIAQIVSETGLEPRFLELELTESGAMNDADATIKIFRELKQHGIRVCIDDFGTGYSSLSYLKRFPIDKLKIDKSFVEFSSSDPDDQAIVETIVAIAHTLKLTVVAEGVETKAQLEFLKSLHCDEWQGYYCSKPVPPAAFEGLLANGWERTDA